MKRARSTAIVLLMGAALVVPAATPLVSAAQTSPAPPGSAPGQSADQIESIVLAKGIKSASLFGSGTLTPIDPSTTFVDTDLPYAIVRIKQLAPNTTVALRLDDPTGAAYTVQAKIPAHRGRLKTFDVAAPLYILGTHFESHTGTWHLKILINGVLARTAAFQWQPATPADLEQIKTAVDGSPLNPDLHWRYGAALALLGHPRQAVTELQNAIRLQPDYALYYITLGRIYQEEHRAPDATAQFQKALTIRGSYYDSVFARWARAGLAKLQGQ